MTRAASATVIAFVLALTAACNQQNASAAAPAPDTTPALDAYTYMPDAPETPVDHPDESFEVLNRSAALYANHMVRYADGSDVFKIADLDVWVRDLPGYHLEWATIEQDGRQYLVADFNYTRRDGEPRWTVMFFEATGASSMRVSEMIYDGETITSGRAIEEVLRGIALDMYHLGMITL